MKRKAWPDTVDTLMHNGEEKCSPSTSFLQLLSLLTADIFAPPDRVFCLPLRCLLNFSVTTFSERGEERKKGGEMYVARKEGESGFGQRMHLWL